MQQLFVHLLVPYAQHRFDYGLAKEPSHLPYIISGLLNFSKYLSILCVSNQSVNTCVSKICIIINIQNLFSAFKALYLTVIQLYAIINGAFATRIVLVSLFTRMGETKRVNGLTSDYYIIDLESFSGPIIGSRPTCSNNTNSAENRESHMCKSHSILDQSHPNIRLFLLQDINNDHGLPQHLGPVLLCLPLVYVFHQNSLVLETVTLGLQIQLMVTTKYIIS